MKLTDPIFSDADKARAYFEAIRWPNGPVCPHCRETEKVYRVAGKAARPGLFHCNACSGQFTVTTGGVMESSKIPLNKWALGFYLYAASKKGFSAHQLHRQLGITYKSAWFMSMRIREAMAPAADADPMGGSGRIVEADETELAPSRKTKVIGGRKRAKHLKWVALVERGGKVRSAVIDGRNMNDVRAAVRDNLHPESILHTDGAQFYKAPLSAEHASVDHDKAFVIPAKGNKAAVHTNSAEGYFSLVKRGLVGVYQHVSPEHLPRYLHEFDFRMSNRERIGVNDTMRTALAIEGAAGKRLTYRNPHAA